MSYSVKLQNVTKKYKMHSKNSEKLKSLLSSKSDGDDFYAVKNVSFEAYKGDVIGIIGVNGSGKSTISNLIADVTAPTTGLVKVKGEVSLIAVSAGLNKELTGRENIELKCLMMGIKKDEIQRIKPDIIDFADIGNFIDMPVKKYSSGMKSRLGFAISISVDPDVLVIDEALSVGDQTFADKCLDKLNEFKENGKTIFFVSHSAAQVKKFCTKALWLEHGTVRDHGELEDVLPKYQEFISTYKKMTKEEQKQFKRKGMKKQAESVDKGNINHSYMSRSNKMKSILMNLLIFTVLFSLMIVTYINKEEVSAYVNNLAVESPDKGSQDLVVEEENNDKDTDKTETNPLENLSIGYVDVDQATFRSEPSSESKVVENVGFGYSFIIDDDGRNEEYWSKRFSDSETEMWISKSIYKSISVNQGVEYEDVLEILEEEDKINNALSFLDKNKAINDREYGNPLLINGQYRYDNGITVQYNKESKANQVTLDNISIEPTQIKSELGDPHLKDPSSSTFLYKTNRYDFLFKANEEENIDQIIITSPLQMD
ncbi:teichoic acids export ABC transporter ATP-binding subunit TagH [Halobacillus litoralis]|uniref:Teichoic acids export ABC transporter ATP-binding subunit TagH n=1 Tax=Halobacillus litoralis TaxID=45668 RepID=A0A845E1F8_9BACI|nr:teichoic acids export ABC transporter ATP-binding subunit TagH [Halobacillus litoralis]MYL20117.1 teichoic acids export ABC transporter ATP-binding subunit TagH [Halobacillus litoralis]